MDDPASQKPVVKKGYRILSRMTFWQFCISKATEQRPRISQKCRSNRTFRRNVLLKARFKASRMSFLNKF